MATISDRDIVNEKTAAQIPVTSYDIDGNEAAPTTIHYYIYDVKAGTAVLTETALTGPFGVTNNIPLTPANNAILDPLLQLEPKRVIVIMNKDTANESRDQKTYYVKNLGFTS